MENGNIKSYSTNNSLNLLDPPKENLIKNLEIVNISNRQSAGVNAPQRINAKELWYILGFIEANGSFSCYKEKDLIKAELTINLEENDIKLLYWIRSVLSFGTVKKLKHSAQKEPSKLIARYIIRSKIFIEKNFLAWFELYPPLTVNKTMHIKYIKDCLNAKQILPKDFKSINYKHTCPDNFNLYFKDWIIGFIEADGNFSFVDRGDKHIAEFNIVKFGEVELINLIAKEMGLSGSGTCILTAVSLKDIQTVINFMYDSNRIRLKGLKKIKFLYWISELRCSPRYNGLKIPFKY